MDDFEGIKNGQFDVEFWEDKAAVKRHFRFSDKTHVFFKVILPAKGKDMAQLNIESLQNAVEHLQIMLTEAKRR